MQRSKQAQKKETEQKAAATTPAKKIPTAKESDKVKLLKDRVQSLENTIAEMIEKEQKQEGILAESTSELTRERERAQDEIKAAARTFKDEITLLKSTIIQKTLTIKQKNDEIAALRKSKDDEIAVVTSRLERAVETLITKKNEAIISNNAALEEMKSELQSNTDRIRILSDIIKYQQITNDEYKLQNENLANEKIQLQQANAAELKAKEMEISEKFNKMQKDMDDRVQKAAKDFQDQLATAQDEIAKLKTQLAAKVSVAQGESKEEKREETAEDKYWQILVETTKFIEDETSTSEEIDAQVAKCVNAFNLKNSNLIEQIKASEEKLKGIAPYLSEHTIEKYNHSSKFDKYKTGQQGMWHNIQIALHNKLLSRKRQTPSSSVEIANLTTRYSLALKCEQTAFNESLAPNTDSKYYFNLASFRHAINEMLVKHKLDIKAGKAQYAYEIALIFKKEAQESGVDQIAHYSAGEAIQILESLLPLLDQARKVENAATINMAEFNEVLKPLIAADFRAKNVISFSRPTAQVTPTVVATPPVPNPTSTTVLVANRMAAASTPAPTATTVLAPAVVAPASTVNPGSNMPSLVSSNVFRAIQANLHAATPAQPLVAPPASNLAGPKK